MKSHNGPLQNAPLRMLSTFDAIAIIVGLIVGSGIFRLPKLVAMNSSSEWMYYAMWALGGVVSLIGALCYAELATAYPNAGGDYYFLQRAYGRNLSFLYGWSRLAVVTSGPVAILGFVFGDYASNILRLGTHSSAIYAVLSVIVFATLNIIGIRESKGTQNVLTVLDVVGLIVVTVTGILLAAGKLPAAGPAAVPADAGGSWYAGAPMAILFVLFTYGGWNDGAYISAEIKDRGGMVRALMLSIAIVTTLYLLVNYAYLHALGLQGIASSDTVASDVMKAVFGPAGSIFISLAVSISALKSVNATFIVGGRLNYALGRDWPVFRWLGHWDTVRDAPRNALLLQAAIALVLIGGSVLTGKEFETLVNYTMPVFWFFVMLVGVGLFILRSRDPNRERPFLVPWYPITPAVFIVTCGYLCFRAVTDAGAGALFGVGVVGAGVLPMLISERARR